MGSSNWNYPQPEKFLLGCGDLYSSKGSQLNQGWILPLTKANPFYPAVELINENPGITFQFFPRFNEPFRSQVKNTDYDPSLHLECFSWDWIEFKHHPLEDLEVKSIYWSPDPGVICGDSWITNHRDQNRDILQDIVCMLKMDGAGNLITSEKINGRSILTGNINNHNLVLFLAGNTYFKEDPSPFLQTKLTFTPNSTENVRWICISSNSKKAALESLENIIQLDWAGEISHRKVTHQSQLEIITGDPDWDFVLAMSQKQSILRYHQLAFQEKHNRPHDINISPIQALMLLQSRENQTSETASTILDLVFNQSSYSNPGRGNSNNNSSPPILAAELLWQIHRCNFSGDIWSNYLEKTTEWLEEWFSPGLDRDADGIPELNHPGILYVGGSDTPAELPSANQIISYPYLESPGLCAIIYNDICRIENLLQIFGNNSDHQTQERKKILSKFLQESWNIKDHEFQNRDSHSHQVVKGFDIFDNLHPGLNILRTDFSQASRIGILHHRQSADHTSEEFSIICHGLDRLGKYRIEEFNSGNFTWGGEFDWEISETVYSKLDYCILNTNAPNGQINLIAPTTSGKDIIQFLPLWAGVLPEDETRDILSRYYLTQNVTIPLLDSVLSLILGESTMQLFWNLLLGHSLLSVGWHHTAAELIGRWMAAIIPVLRQSGGFFPGYGSKTGTGKGIENSLESLFPVKFFLEVLGISFLQDNQLRIEGENPFPWPVTLKFKGYEIRREKHQTTITHSGKDTISLSESANFQIDLN